MPDQSLDRKPDQRPSTPTWVKLLGLAIIVSLALVVVVMLVSGGQHGPGQHTAALAAALLAG